MTENNPNKIDYKTIPLNELVEHQRSVSKDSSGYKAAEKEFVLRTRIAQIENANNEKKRNTWMTIISIAASFAIITNVFFHGIEYFEVNPSPPSEIENLFEKASVHSKVTKKNGLFSVEIKVKYTNLVEGPDDISKVGPKSNPLDTTSLLNVNLQQKKID